MLFYLTEIIICRKKNNSLRRGIKKEENLNGINEVSCKKTLKKSQLDNVKSNRFTQKKISSSVHAPMLVVTNSLGGGSSKTRNNKKLKTKTHKTKRV